MSMDAATEKQEQLTLEKQTENIIERINNEPAYRTVLYKILAHCQTPRSNEDLEKTVLSFPEMKRAMHTPQEILFWLEDCGALEKGKENDIVIWQTTEAGINAAEKESFQNQLTRLFINEAEYQEIFLEILKACLKPKSRSEIESLLMDNPIMKESGILASYFIDRLERAGGLVWDGKWKTTKVGKEFFSNYSSHE